MKNLIGSHSRNAFRKTTTSLLFNKDIWPFLNKLNRLFKDIFDRVSNSIIKLIDRNFVTGWFPNFVDAHTGLDE